MDIFWDNSEYASEINIDATNKQTDRQADRQIEAREKGWAAEGGEGRKVGGTKRDN